MRCPSRQPLDPGQLAQALIFWLIGWDVGLAEQGHELGRLHSPYNLRPRRCAPLAIVAFIQPVFRAIAPAGSSGNVVGEGHRTTAARRGRHRALRARRLRPMVGPRSAMTHGSAVFSCQPFGGPLSWPIEPEQSAQRVACSGTRLRGINRSREWGLRLGWLEHR